MEVVRYVSPAPEEHGHWVQPEGEVPRLTRCYVQKAEMVPNEGTWIALEKETVDELSKRRRIREKSSIRLLKSEEMSSSQDPEELKAEGIEERSQRNDGRERRPTCLRLRLK